MKTFASLTAAFLMFLSVGVLANTRPDKKTVNAPAFTWGSPEDLNTAEVERLKNRPAAVNQPQFSWGSPEDLKGADLEILKVVSVVTLPLPEIVIGSADDLDDAEVARLKHFARIPYPAIVVGNPEDIEVSDLL